jgi:putative SOS response-associated peptidase YedK
LINARVETAATRPAFREAFRARRCIVPASGFYEWASRGDFRQPYWIAPGDGAPWGIAGLWERWTAPSGAQLESCALLTTAANARIADLHDRMPAILAPADYAVWLDAATDTAALAALLAPLGSDALELRPVGTRVNRVENDDAALLDAVPEPPRQPSLF